MHLVQGRSLLAQVYFTIQQAEPVYVIGLEEHKLDNSTSLMQFKMLSQEHDAFQYDPAWVCSQSAASSDQHPVRRK